MLEQIWRGQGRGATSRSEEGRGCPCSLSSLWAKGSFNMNCVLITEKLGARNATTYYYLSRWLIQAGVLRRVAPAPSEALQASLENWFVRFRADLSWLRTSAGVTLSGMTLKIALSAGTPNREIKKSSVVRRCCLIVERWNTVAESGEYLWCENILFSFPFFFLLYRENFEQILFPF